MFYVIFTKLNALRRHCYKLELFDSNYSDLGKKKIDGLTVNIMGEFVYYKYGCKKQTSIHQILPSVFESKCIAK